mmetsp:Transcript_6141/g.13392  ORF Transcript_6141/g.13392 Transcript_6141/m.13392 type:complete len:201 (-) Transcript_6141:1639-2241(-)
MARSDFESDINDIIVFHNRPFDLKAAEYEGGLYASLAACCVPSRSLGRFILTISHCRLVSLQCVCISVLSHVIAKVGLLERTVNKACHFVCANFSREARWCNCLLFMIETETLLSGEGPPARSALAMNKSKIVFLSKFGRIVFPAPDVISLVELLIGSNSAQILSKRFGRAKISGDNNGSGRCMLSDVGSTKIDWNCASL